MNLVMIPALAVKALRRNMMRSGLTTLGIVIGVSAGIWSWRLGKARRPIGEPG